MNSLADADVLVHLPDEILLGREVVAEPLPGHPEVLILRLRSTRDSIGLVAKRTCRTEYSVHSLLFRDLPHVVPKLHATFELAANDWVMVMDDLAEERQTIEKPVQAVRLALSHLSEIHTRFAGENAIVNQLGLRVEGTVARDVASRLRTSVDVLTVLNELAGLKISTDQLGGARAIALDLVAMTECLSRHGHFTLVHGDFHFDNILVREGDIRVSDWGSAASQVAPWDLVMFGETEVNYYLQCAGEYDGFFQDLKAAVLYRMAGFIPIGLKLLLSGVADAGDMLKVCIERLNEAASTDNFRGGRGIRLPRATGLENA